VELISRSLGLFSSLHLCREIIFKILEIIFRALSWFKILGIIFRAQLSAENLFSRSLKLFSIGKGAKIYFEFMQYSKLGTHPT